MPNDSDFDDLLADTPLPSAVRMGYDWHQQLVFESSKDPNLHMGRQKIGAEKSELAGHVKVEGNDSIQKSLAGPLVEQDAPTGIVPSTLFTPFPRDMYGIDSDYFEILALAAMAAALGLIVIGVANAK